MAKRLLTGTHGAEDPTEFIDPKRYAQLVVDHDRVVTF
jgi:hypothetical protein